MGAGCLPKTKLEPEPDDLELDDPEPDDPEPDDPEPDDPLHPQGFVLLQRPQTGVSESS